MHERKITVALEEGLHARPAARIVKLSKTFAAAIEIVKGDIVANSKSAIKIMLLGARQGEEVVVRATGADAEQAVAAITAMIAGADESPYPERPHSPPLTVPAQPTPALHGGARNTEQLISGISASAGIAVGEALLHLPGDIKARSETIPAERIPAALAEFRKALSSFLDQVQVQIAALEMRHPSREILVALANLANDPDLIGPIEARITAGQDPANATLAAGRQLARSFRALGDGYFTARAEDIDEITRQVAAQLLGLPVLNAAALREPRIIVADTMGVIEFSRLPTDKVLGLVCLDGAASSHLAILARSLGIPAVFGLQASIDDLRHVRMVALDGGAGLVSFDPDPGQRDAFLRDAAEMAAERTALAPYVNAVPRTMDGIDIEIAANLNLPLEAQAALKNGAMGVGLLRTEFLFMERRSLPSEDEQAEVYANLARNFAPHAVIIRTLDVGGDKPLPGVKPIKEENPFLGWRGIRLCLDRLDIFKPQLRALLRAAVYGNIKIMIPMVADIDELREAKELIAICAAELSAEGIAARIPDLGIMIETPAAVMCAGRLAEEVAFFSIGTNDLTQYTMAVDRMHTNPRLARLCRTSHPAVLRMIELTCAAAHDKGIWVGVCGEAAGDPALIPTLLAYGVTEFSMESSQIPRAKKLVMECMAGRA